MTPEERVKLLLFGKANYGEVNKSTASGESHFRVTYPEVVAMIRDAVKAEREACADIAVTHFDYRDDPIASGCGAIIASVISERTP